MELAQIFQPLGFITVALAVRWNWMLWPCVKTLCLILCVVTGDSMQWSWILMVPWPTVMSTLHTQHTLTTQALLLPLCSKFLFSESNPTQQYAIPLHLLLLCAKRLSCAVGSGGMMHSMVSIWLSLKMHMCARVIFSSITDYKETCGTMDRETVVHSKWFVFCHQGSSVVAAAAKWEWYQLITCLALLKPGSCIFRIKL